MYFLPVNSFSSFSSVGLANKSFHFYSSFRATQIPVSKTSVVFSSKRRKELLAKLEFYLYQIKYFHLPSNITSKMTHLLFDKQQSLN